MLRIVMEEGCSTQKQVLNYLGERFRVKLSLPDWYPNEQAAEFLFKYVKLFLRVGQCLWLPVRIYMGLVSHLEIRIALGVGFWCREIGANFVPAAILTFLFLLASYFILYF